MRKILATCLLASFSACGPPKIPAPALFPVKTAWTALGEDSIQEPLASDESRVFVAGRAGSLRAVDALTGEVLWQALERPGLLGYGEGLLVLRQTDGRVRAMDPATGAVRWSTEAAPSGELPPVVAGGRVYVAGAGLAALDAATGRTLWTVGAPSPVTTTPVVAEPCVLAGESDGTLRCRATATGASLWTHATASVLLAPPIVDGGGRVLLGTTDRGFVALKLRSRGRRRWRWKVGADVTAQAAILEDKVLFACYDAVLYAVKRSNGHLIWRAPLPSRPIGAPLLLGASALVACHEDQIVGFDGRTGDRLGDLRTPAGILTPPLLVGDRVYVGLRDRSVVAFQLSREARAPQASPSPRERKGRKSVP